MDVPGLIFLAIGLISVGGAAHVVLQLARSGGSGRNSALGIRTKNTVCSDAGWAAGHTAAVPYLRRAAAIAYVIGFVSIVLAVLRREASQVSPGWVIVPVTGYVAAIAVLLLGVRKADSAAAPHCPSSR